MQRQLWDDESGAVISTELALILSILGIGLVTGATTLRDAIVTELADTGQAISNTDQSFHIPGVTARSSVAGGSVFSDALDFGDNGVGGTNSRGLIIAPAGPLNSTEGTKSTIARP